ncbi:MAG: hypothetical protein AMJ59_02660 [Gammaproteobacteria bacterium SG8_31]|jgi:hypothetical protein|nr:MAG: hypothetical protein AMJ59_02660 [Gammaproteobacteria bacterium SG8_31]
MFIWQIRLFREEVAMSSMRMEFLLPLVVMTLSAGGCSVTRPADPGMVLGRESGMVTNTIYNKTPAGVEPAWIYEIDGEQVNYLRRSTRLSVGEHTIKVWPKDDAPRSQQMVPDRTRIQREDIVVEDIVIDVEPGYRYYIGARTNITRTKSTIVGTETYNFPSGKFIIPVVVREAEPADYVEGAKGMSLFFLSMAIPAAIAGSL